MKTKRVTSQDVADFAGVSRATVSFVLNDVQGIKISPATRQRVLDAARDLGYVPDAAAKALASRRSHIIGLILTRSPHHIASDGFLTQILDGLIEITHQHDMRLLIDIIEPQHQKEVYLQMARAKRIDGILLSGPRFDDDALRALEEDGFPTVLIGQLPGTEFCSVDVDNRAAAKQAVAHLLNLGHKRVVCLTNASASYTAAADRVSGYKDALENAGLQYDQALVRYGDFDTQSGFKQMTDLLNSDVDFTAAFVASDTVALGAMAAINEHGLEIPKDVALVGFDDLSFSCYLHPPLTTVRLPAVDLASKAADMIIQILETGKAACQQVLLETRLIVRESCGAEL